MNISSNALHSRYPLMKESMERKILARHFENRKMIFESLIVMVVVVVIGEFNPLTYPNTQLTTPSPILAVSLSKQTRSGPTIRMPLRYTGVSR